MYRELPSQEYLLECFKYVRSTGQLRWRVRPVWHFKSEAAMLTWNARFAGKIIDKPNKRGYFDVVISYTRYLAHRIIWKLVHGEDPGEHEVDHRDLNCTNNRIKNLRLANRSEQSQNKPKYANNSTGVKGVTYDKARDRYVGQVMCRGVHHRTSRYATLAEAQQAVTQLRHKVHGEFVRD